MAKKRPSKKSTGYRSSEDRQLVRIHHPTGRHIQLRYTCQKTGKEMRVSTGTTDRREAEKKRRELEARIVLGQPVIQVQKANQSNPDMSWQDFREQYRTLQLATLRTKSQIDAENRLDIAERILKPKTLADLASTNAIQTLQEKLLNGASSLRNKPRSKHTVRGYVTAVLAALNWAYQQGWIEKPVKFRKLKVAKSRRMKGRPLTLEEFQKMLGAVSQVVGEDGAKSWEYLLQGLWESALRLGELLRLSWDLPNSIQPRWSEGSCPTLEIPADLQKNDKDESIPLLPGFEKLLQETPVEQRTGWVFCPSYVRGFTFAASRRPTVAWVGKIVSKIGQVAGVCVAAANDRTGYPQKFASAHDLRRSCAQRLLKADVPPLTIARVMRHESWETTQKYYAPGDVQNDAQVLRDRLGGDA